MKTPRSMRSLAAGLLWLPLACLSARTAWASEGSLQLVPRIDLLLGLLIFFLLLVAPLNALLFRPLLRTLDARADRINGTRERAERLNSQSLELRTRYESALREGRDAAERSRRERIEEARVDFQGRTGEARADAEQRIEASRSELSASLEQARSQLSQQARELAREAAARVLGRSL